MSDFSKNREQGRNQIVFGFGKPDTLQYQVPYLVDLLRLIPFVQPQCITFLFNTQASATQPLG
ncbi:MAG: hypothetical protein LBN39_10215 [Planctomycetaceae bacterium]|nr:hypothetical protein [Planctomycetaceae bacterium]